MSGAQAQTMPSETGYAHPEVLVDTAWVAEHTDDPSVRIIEADEDPLLYEVGHIKNAVKLDWHVDVQDPVRRDFVSQADFEALMRRYGISNDTTVVLYGDKNNWYAAYTFWLFRMYGHRDLRIMNGGRTKWEAEQRPYVTEAPQFAATTYTAKPANLDLRAFRAQVEAHLAKHGALIDVRSLDEYTGKLLHMVNYPQEGAQRGGHIPSAQSIPWATAANPSDGTFKSAEELRQIYGGKGITPDREVIAYCRIGERSAHTWFVLTQLLGYPSVRNYDGSWTEWGNLVGAPITKGEEP
jgi:thiosulfate/3-mercaptopyruvate sulfurtransferase